MSEQTNRESDLTPEQLAWQEETRQLRGLARRFVALLPPWMDEDDLLQEGHIARALGQRPVFAMIQALRQTKRMRQHADSVRSGLPRWREPIMLSWEQINAVNRKPVLPEQTYREEDGCGAPLIDKERSNPCMSEPAPRPDAAFTERDAVRLAHAIDGRLLHLLVNLAHDMGVCTAGAEVGLKRNRVSELTSAFRKQFQEAA